MNPYDRVLYPSHPHPQTHPDRLATIAALFGMQPAPVDACRVLELGCGNGSNLAPMAWTLPESSFFGIDLAERPVRLGQEMIAQLGLNNIHLERMDLLELKPGWQQFDYIIVHGLFSWVPGPVRQHLLALCRGCLAPAGVAFISYAAYPGCHLRNMLREMMLFHVRAFESPDERVEQAVSLVRFLAQGQEVDDVYRRWMKAELEQILGHDPGHLFHDELAELNQPFYFTQFMAEAGLKHLQFVGEADFFEMSDHMFPTEVRNTLGQLGRQRLLREQYLDFLKCRRFRQTLLCREDVALASAARPEAIHHFTISSSVTCPASPDLREGVTARFEAPRGAKAETDFPLGKAALVALSEAGPKGLLFDSLAREVNARLLKSGLEEVAQMALRERLADFLLRVHGAGVVEFRTRPPRCAQSAGERPIASPVARWQIQHGEVVTSLLHIAVHVEDSLARYLLTLLDGTCDRAALAEQLWQFIKAQEATPAALASGSGARRDLEAGLERNLRELAGLGLLVG